MKKDRIAASQAGANDFVTKPFSPLALRMRLQPYLEERPAPPPSLLDRLRQKLGEGR